jgi:hypothetical protein
MNFQSAPPTTTDANIFLALIDGARETDMNTNGLTWPQIQYWAIACSLGIAGIVFIVGAQFIALPSLTTIGGEIGVALLTSGILAGLVEPFFRQEFARDAFLAAFRYVLPPEYKDEVGKILRNAFIGERQKWRVQIDRVAEDTVVVMTSFEKVIANKTSSTQKKSGLFTTFDFNFPQGPSEILQCGIESGHNKVEEFNLEKSKGEIRATTEEINIGPGESARVWGLARQYRRANDIIYETFTTPAIDPEIEVIIPDDMMFTKEFGTIGDIEDERYTKRFKLRGVYFPGQYMLVRWWPRDSLNDKKPEASVAVQTPDRS